METSSATVGGSEARIGFPQVIMGFTALMVGWFAYGLLVSSWTWSLAWLVGFAVFVYGILLVLRERLNVGTGAMLSVGLVLFVINLAVFALPRPCGLGIPFERTIMKRAMTWKGGVSEVVDAGTLKVKCGSKVVLVKLYGVQAPAKSDDFSGQGKKILSDLVAGKRVKVSRVDTLPDGASRAWVSIGDKMINDEVIRLGAARWKDMGEAKVWSRWYDETQAKGDNERLSKLQEQARTAKVGLWAGAKPAPAPERKPPAKQKKS